MTERVASILAEIGIDSSGFTSGASSILEGVGGIAGAFEALSAGVGGIAGAFEALSAAGIVTFLTEVTAKEFELAAGAAEAAQNEYRLSAAIENSGGKSKANTKDLEDYALKLSRVTGIEDDVIIRAESLAVSFGLQGDQIKKTTLLAADMSAYFETDMTAQMQKLSRAFGSFDGYTLLQRQLEKFNPAQIDALDKFKKNNDMIGYQNYLITILSDKYHDMAAGISDAGTGQDKYNAEMKIFTDNLGNLLLPEVRQFFTEMTAVLHVINENFQAVSTLYYGMEGLYRIMLAIVTLGMSEFFKFGPSSWMDKGTTPHMLGGSFVIPQTYGAEGFNLPGGHTASAGETVTIGQAGGAGGASLSVGNIYIGNTSGFTRSDVKEMITDSFAEAMGR